MPSAALLLCWGREFNRCCSSADGRASREESASSVRPSVLAIVQNELACWLGLCVVGGRGCTERGCFIHKVK